MTDETVQRYKLEARLQAATTDLADALDEADSLQKACDSYSKWKERALEAERTLKTVNEERRDVEEAAEHLRAVIRSQGEALDAHEEEIENLSSDLLEVWTALTVEVEDCERLNTLIEAAGKHWLSIEGIPWEGAIDEAMEAAVGEIQRLRERLERVRKVRDSYEKLCGIHVSAARLVDKLDDALREEEK